MHRREALCRLLAACGALAVMPTAVARKTDDDPFAALERRHGVTLGVAAMDTGSGAHLAHRGDERFAILSTFKLLLAGAILARVDAGTEHLDRRIIVPRKALLEWAPVTRLHVGAPGMTVAALNHAAITESDNTAANLLLHSLGGPAALTRWLRSLGDAVTRLDRTEPSLNDVAPGELRDTTTPSAMLADVVRLVTGNVLTPASRMQLVAWLRASRTGAKRIAAGLPADWQHGDKTGSNHDASNDVAVLSPPARAPILVAAYCRGGDNAARDAALAATGREIAARWAR